MAFRGQITVRTFRLFYWYFRVNHSLRDFSRRLAIFHDALRTLDTFHAACSASFAEPLRQRGWWSIPGWAYREIDSYLGKIQGARPPRWRVPEGIRGSLLGARRSLAVGITELPIGERVASPPPESVYEAAESRVDTPTGERAAAVLNRLEREYPSLYCFLDGRTPFQLLVAVILSAQATDETVNQVTPALFEQYPTPAALAAAPREDVEELIYSTGFYRRKAEYIQETAARIVDEYDGEVPQTLDALIEFPGVARKTATAVLWYAFGRIEGITVDTHVQRLATRLGFSEAETPVGVERDLMELVPMQRWPWVTYLFISHGRAVCQAQRPDCAACVVSTDCPSAFTFSAT